jgi:SecD/SecF fusion protein
MKEQRIKSGKTLEEAVKTSYSWRGAMSSIQMNVTHILTGAVLFIFGSGPLRVSRTTLIGIITSLFTFIARIFIDLNIKRTT